MPVTRAELAAYLAKQPRERLEQLFETHAKPKLIARHQAELDRRLGVEPEDPSMTWARSFAGLPIEFIAQIMPEWMGPDWAAWRAFVKTLFGIPLDPRDQDVVRLCTGLEPVQAAHPHREAFLPIGRRGGKSRTLAMIAIYLAVCFDWTPHLAPGQFGYVSVLSDSKAHAGEIMNYVKGALGHPRLLPIADRDLAETVELKGRIRIQVVTASIKAVRARTVIAGLCVAKGTLIETENGQRPIETVRAGDKVWTRKGLRSVLKAGMTCSSAEVRRVEFSNGGSLAATPDHPVFVSQKGFITVCSLRPGDEVLEWNQIAASTAALESATTAAPRAANLALGRFVNKNSESGFPQLTASGLSSGVGSAGTCLKMGITGTEQVSYSTAMSIWQNMDLFRQVLKLWFTMKITTERIFQSITCRDFLYPSTLSNMALAALPHGVLGTRDTRSEFMPCGQIGNRLREIAPIADSRIPRPECDQSTAVLRVEIVPERVSVYNLKVAGTPEYFANGILTHNCDELAFWESDEEAANPDVEILRSLRPAMATIPNSLLLCASSRYARRGALWEAYRDHYGKPDGPLVWSADTLTMHPSIDREFIDGEYERDPVAAAAEYGLEWRSDLAAFIERERVQALVVPGRYQLPYRARTEYFAFGDPSGGSRDSFTLAIAHADEAGRGILDCMYERRAPFVPSEVVSEISVILKDYSLHKVTGDRYAGEWPVDGFAKEGIAYEHSELTKVDIYRDSLPTLMSGQVELLDSRRLVSQISSLERRTARGGRDSIDHPPNGMDDLANAALGALVNVTNKTGALDVWKRLAG